MASTITDRVAIAVTGGAISAGGYGTISCSNVAGTNVVTATGSPSISGYVTNMMYAVRPFALNTGPVDINIDNRGLVSVLKPNSSELDANDFNPALEYLLKFDGTNMKILTPSF